VLPFLSLDATPIDPALQLGMADALITQLSGSPELIVRPVSSVRRLVDIDRDALQAGRDLAVDTLLDGSVQQSGDTIRVTARLIRVSDGTAIWADRFDEPFTGIFEVQDAISQRIVSALGLNIPLQEHGGTQNLQAYEKYLEGRLNLARLNAEQLELAISYFQEAVTLDPDYALAWLGLANVHFRIPLAGEANPLEHYPVGKAAGMKALELEPLMAEGYAMLGWIAHWYEWDWVASEQYFLRAIELDPNDTEAHLGYAHLLSNQGRHEQAMAEVRRARELSPLHMVAASLEGAFLLGAGQMDEAVRAAEQAVRLDPEFWLARMNLAVAMSVSGRIEEGLEQIRIAREISGGGTYPMALEVSFLVMLGRRDEAEALYEAMLLASEENFVPPYHLAYASIALGYKKEALEWLQRGYEVRDPKLVFLEVLPIWKQLSAEPGFIELINRMNLSR
jgi:TolB-like protein/Flp pilus assembly protein TadD